MDKKPTLDNIPVVEHTTNADDLMSPERLRREKEREEWLKDKAEERERAQQELRAKLEDQNRRMSKGITIKGKRYSYVFENFDVIQGRFVPEIEDHLVLCRAVFTIFDQVETMQKYGMFAIDPAEKDEIDLKNEFIKLAEEDLNNADLDQETPETPA